VYNREEVLGRDIKSVFPSESKKMVSMDPEKAKLLLGAGDRKFISQSELEEIQAARGKMAMTMAVVSLKDLLLIFLKREKKLKMQNTKNNGN
jgi:hypothetical protein